jgi:hypothetical protein
VIVFGGFRGPLVAVSVAGYVLQYLAFREYYTIVRGDGWEELGPGLAIFVFCPVQLTTAISVLLAYMRSVSELAAREAQPSTLAPGAGAYGLDEVPVEQERARRIARVAVWTLSVPAAVMALLTALEWIGAPLPGANVLAGPMAVVWAPAWFTGVVAAVVAMGQRHDSSLLWLAAVYPGLVIAYANS